jgi:hypothetical protein
MTRLKLGREGGVAPSSFVVLAFRRCLFVLCFVIGSQPGPLSLRLCVFVVSSLSFPEPTIMASEHGSDTELGSENGRDGCSLLDPNTREALGEIPSALSGGMTVGDALGFIENWCPASVSACDLMSQRYAWKQGLRFVLYSSVRALMRPRQWRHVRL